MRTYRPTGWTSDGQILKSPQTITATTNPNHFLVASIADYNKGLSTLVIERDANDAITGVTLKAIPMNQPGQSVQKDRLNLQRAQSAVLVRKDGVDYAIVSDDNYAFLDPYWKAMYEAPMFIYGPGGTPFAVGGSASAKKVNVGGKLGIVQDPFGTPQYLGATLPLDGYGIINLSLSGDGEVLIGQLKGGYSGNTSSPNWLTQLPNANAAWNVDNLIDAALTQPEADRLKKHLNLPPNTLINIPGPHTGQPIGTTFDATLPTLRVEGRLGDVIEVDLKRLLAEALSPLEQLITTGLTDFELDAADLFTYADDYTADGYTPFTLVTAAGQGNHDVYTRAGSQTADFATTGRLYLVPKLTAADLEQLRNGQRVTQDKHATLNFSFKLRTDDGVWVTQHTSVTVSAKDIAEVNTFFGDRPLDNPGYSKFDLSGSVAANATNDVLDVYRVEQRLKYLGFPAMGYGNPTLQNNEIQNFTVDGNWGEMESYAAHLFGKVVHYGPGNLQLAAPADRNTSPGALSRAPNRATYFSQLQQDASAFRLTGSDVIFNYLNAYNAPHWMNIGVQMEYQGRNATTPQSTYSMAGWKNTQNGGVGTTQVERYGTSWMRDLLVAKQFTATALVQSGSLFNGAVDANHGYTPFNHGTHDLGMSLDLGVSNYIYQEGAQKDKTEPLTLDIAQLMSDLLDPLDPAKGTKYENIPDPFAYEAGEWSYANAIYLSGLLTDIRDPATQKNDQVSALRDFLSLYAVQRIGGSYSDGLRFSSDRTPAEEAIIRAALFGDGTVNGGLISKVHIGGSGSANPYKNINEILVRLGITSSASSPHESHFHIYLRPPAPVGIDGPNHLLTDAQPELATETPNVALQTQAQGLLDYAQALFSTGEELVFTIDIPYVPSQETPVLLAQAPASGADATQQPDYILEECQQTLNAGDPKSAWRSVDPAYMLKNYIQNTENRSVELAAIKTSLVEGVHYGKIFAAIDNKGFTAYHYDPVPGYIGKDRAVFMAEFEGKRYKIVLELVVGDDIIEVPRDVLIDLGLEPPCPEPQLIKVNKPANGSSIIDLSTLNFSALEGGALGQSDLTGITLDANANGYTWYIDLTPGLNDEFLPTSNPYEWIAKPGSQAEGKMDLLTVLLHEAAHSLGLDHTNDAHALMAPTLQPGVRRLPSTELLAELQPLSNDDALAVGRVGTSSVPTRDPAPNAPLPLGIGFTVFWQQS